MSMQNALKPQAARPVSAEALVLPKCEPLAEVQLCAAQASANRQAIDRSAERAYGVFVNEMKGGLFHVPNFDRATNALGALNTQSFARLCEIYQDRTGKPFVETVNKTVWGGSGIVNALTRFVTGENYGSILRRQCEELQKRK